MEMNENMKKAIEAKLAERRKLQENMQMALIDNSDFMDAQTRILGLAKEVAKLDTIITQLNTGITPFVAKDGSKYSVRVFPIQQFGIGLDKLMGIIAGSASAFTDDMAMQYEAIAGVPFIELQIANDTLGTVDYVNKDGIYVEGSRTEQKNELPGTGIEHLKAVQKWEQKNAKDLKILIESIAMKLGLYEIVPTTEKLVEMLKAWERKAEIRATKQQKEIEQSKKLDAKEEFTIDE